MKIININLKKLLVYLQLSLEQQQMAEDCFNNEVFETAESNDKVENEKTVLLKGQVKYLRTLLWTCAPDEARKQIIAKWGEEEMSNVESVRKTLDEYIGKIHINKMIHKSIDNGEKFVTSMVNETTEAVKAFLNEIKEKFPFTFNKF